MKVRTIINLALLLLILSFFGCGEDKKITDVGTPTTSPISTPSSVRAYQLFYASLTVTDSQNLSVQVRFHWGNSESSEYTDMKPSGTTFEVPYAYLETGNYKITASIRNSAGTVNEIGEATGSSITVTQAVGNDLIQSVIVDDNILYVTSLQPINVKFTYQIAPEVGYLFQGYSSQVQKNSHRISLPITNSSLSYEIELSALNAFEQQDTTFTFVSTNRRHKLLKVDFVDVGQGDGMLINTPEDQTIIIDGGRKGSFYATPRMLNYVTSKNVQHIRYMVETHYHFDHYGGLQDIIEAEIPYDIYLSNHPVGYDNPYYQPHSYVVGDFLDVSSNVSFKILNIGYPAGVTQSGINNMSIVIRMEYNEIAFLFMGDAEAPAENYLVNNHFQSLTADLVKLGHHGSDTSSTQSFRDAALNRFAKVGVISFGNNQWGHPHNLDRFTDYDIFGTGLPTGSWEGDNYHFETGTIEAYSDGYSVIMSYNRDVEEEL